MMTNEEIRQIAMLQSCYDSNARCADFLQDTNVLVPFKMAPQARKYLKNPITANLISYGNNIVAAVTPEVRNLVADYLERFTFYHCFETPNMHWLNDRLMDSGHKVCFMAEYFLPDVTVLQRLSAPYSLRIMEKKDFEHLYLPEWSNALCEDRKELDILGYGAYDGDRLVGFACSSADCDSMWQIGVDVLPAYRRKGIAAALTSNLAVEILERGKVPFYCCAWSNLKSAGNAIKSGFRPAWVEMTIKPAAIVDEMNGSQSAAE